MATAMPRGGTDWQSQLNDFNLGGYQQAPPQNQLPGVSYGLPTYDNPYELRGLFNDPATIPMMSALTTRMQQLQQPGPQFGEYEGALRSGLSQLMHPLANDPTVAAAMQKLMAGGGGMPGNPYEAQYATHTGEQYADLMKEPFSAGEEAAMKEKYLGQIELDHGTARQQMLEHLAAMGNAPTSGTAVAALQQVDQHFEQLRAAAQNQLLTDTVGLRDKRHAEALAASAGLGGFGQNAQQIAAQYRNIQMQSIAQAAQLALAQRQAAQDRLIQGIGVGGNLAQLQQQRYQQGQTNWDQLLQLSGVPQQLVNQRMGVLGSAMTNPGDIGGGYNALANQYGNEAQTQRSRNAANTIGVGGAIGDAYDIYNQRKNAPQQPQYNAGYYGPAQYSSYRG